ncbi:hypothetical protein RJT34_20471 [Clitoria ternatea]|uniref:Uncharacterized protein n=1 Tax=Clitoria ternatea TaxID=43366 RepID=A0AAN9P4Y1_CLITE
MKSWSISVAAFAFTLLLLSSTLSTRVNIKVHSRLLSKTTSSHRALVDFRTHRKNLSKRVDSSFRRIPPSKSNPTQNNFNPPTYG